MTQDLSGNLLVVQAGKPAAIVNSCLAGIISEALNHLPIEEIYGGLNGISGVLNEEIIDLAEESQQAIRGLFYTPGSALGAGQIRKYSNENFKRLLEVFTAHNIRYLIVIGDKYAQQLASEINDFCKLQGYEVYIIGVPATIENNLPITDHCPGYGSAIKYLATTIREIGVDHRGIAHHDLVSIVEIMGLELGWNTAGSSLAKRRNHDEDPPHLILFPEVIFDAETFVARVREVLRVHTHCMIITGEGLIDDSGNYVAHSNIREENAFAKTENVSSYLQNLISQSLPRIEIATHQLGRTQRSAAHLTARVDNEEAQACGEFSVKKIVTGESGKMVTLIRTEGDDFGVEFGLVGFSEVVEQTKTFPQHWINEDGTSLNYQYFKYAHPLIQGEVQVNYENGLPKFIEIAANRVNKQLPTYDDVVNPVKLS